MRNNCLSKGVYKKKERSIMYNMMNGSALIKSLVAALEGKNLPEFYNFSIPLESNPEVMQNYFNLLQLLETATTAKLSKIQEFFHKLSAEEKKKIFPQSKITIVLDNPCAIIKENGLAIKSETATLTIYEDNGKIFLQVSSKVIKLTLELTEWQQLFLIYEFMNMLEYANW